MYLSRGSEGKMKTTRVVGTLSLWQFLCFFPVKPGLQFCSPENETQSNVHSRFGLFWSFFSYLRSLTLNSFFCLLAFVAFKKRKKFKLAKTAAAGGGDGEQYQPLLQWECQQAYGNQPRVLSCYSSCLRINAYSFKSSSGIFKINKTDVVLRSFPKGPNTVSKSIYLIWQKGSMPSTQLGFEHLLLADGWSKSCSSYRMGTQG